MAAGGRCLCTLLTLYCSARVEHSDAHVYVHGPAKRCRETAHGFLQDRRNAIAYGNDFSVMILNPSVLRGVSGESPAMSDVVNEADQPQVSVRASLLHGQRTRRLYHVLQAPTRNVCASA